LGKGEKNRFQSRIKEKKEKSKEPYKIMLVGLFGTGKTTTAGKLGNILRKEE
jgi:signal recognition particle GTPase